MTELLSRRDFLKLGSITVASMEAGLPSVENTQNLTADIVPASDKFTQFFLEKAKEKSISSEGVGFFGIRRGSETTEFATLPPTEIVDSTGQTVLADERLFILEHRFSLHGGKYMTIVELEKGVGTEAEMSVGNIRIPLVVWRHIKENPRPHKNADKIVKKDDVLWYPELSGEQWRIIKDNPQLKVLAGVTFADFYANIEFAGFAPATNVLSSWLIDSSFNREDEDSYRIDLNKLTGEPYKSLLTKERKRVVPGVGTPLTVENLDAKKWGIYSLIENPDGYYEMKDVQGNLIPEVKLFRDGTAELTYSSKKLAVAFEAITIGPEGQLAFGLWDYQNDKWTMAPGHSAEDIRSGEYANDFHKLVVVRGNDEIESRLTDTIFMARDLYMNNTEGYRPASEFEGITVTYNFKTVENFDVRPKEWQMNNFSRNWKALGKNGAYRFQPFSQNSEVVYDDGSTLSYARPIQVGLLGPGWFKVDIYNKGELSQAVYHMPIVAMNTDRSIAQASTLVDKEHLSSLIPLLTKEKRGQIIPFLFTKIVPPTPYLIFSNKALMSFTSSVNQANYVDVVGVPELDTDYPLQSFSKEFSKVFLTLVQDPRY